MKLLQSSWVTSPEIVFGPLRRKLKIPGFQTNALSPLQLQLVSEKKHHALSFSYKKLDLINLKCKKNLFLGQKS